MPKELKLHQGFLDANIRPTIIDGELTSLHIAKDGSGARISGGLEVDGPGKRLVADPLVTNAINYDGDLYISRYGTDGDGTIVLMPNNYFRIGELVESDGTTHFGAEFNTSGAGGAGIDMKFRSLLNGDDYFLVATGTDGATTISTVDDDGTDGDLTFTIDGHIDMNSGSGQDITLDSGTDVILDPNSGITKFMLAGDTDDLCTLTVAANGVTTIATADSDGEVGHLTLAPDGDTIIDRNVANTDAGTYTGLSIDYDKTGTSTSDNTLYGLNIDMDNTTATNGTNTMYGIHCTPTLTHAADAGTVTTIGGYFKATCHTNGTTKNIGVQIEQVPISDNSLGLQITSSVDTDDFFSISTGASGATTIATVDDGAAAGHLTLDIDGDVILDAQSGRYFFNVNGETDDYGRITINAGTGTMTLATASASADGHIVLSPDGDIILNSGTGNYIAKNAATEFSPASSSYAGMILGYTHLTSTATEESFTVPTNAVSDIAVIDADAKVSFVAPPSGNVEIEVGVFRDSSTSNETINFGISDNATYNQVSAEIGDGSSAYDLITQFSYGYADETDDMYMIVKFVACGLTPNASYEWWIGAYASSGTTYLKWGGRTLTSPDRYFPPFIIKATALPTDAVIHTQ